MAQGIVDSLFGISPYQAEQQRFAQDENYAAKLAGMNNIQQAKFGIGQGAAGLTRNVAQGMFGMVDPTVQEAKMRETVMGMGGDLSTSAGLKAKAAQFAAAGDQATAMKLVMLARQQEAKEQEQMLAGKKDAREELKMNRDAVWKHEEAMEKIKAARDAAMQRSEDVRRGQDYQDANKKEALRLQSMLIDMKDRQMNPSAKPLPPKALQMQGDALEAMNLAANISTNISSLSKQIESGELNLGLVANLKNKVRNKIGLSTEESRNLASLDATLQKLRNDSLRLNKGTQTEGDAVRAWDELVNNINDPKVVKQRLDEISRLNENAVDFQKKQVDMIRMNYGHEPLDTSAYTAQPASVGADKEKAWEAKTPNDVKDLYKAGKLNKEQATAILKDMESQGKF